MQKITQLIDIEAPCEDVFNTIIDIHKRMQLSPLWGIGRLQEVSPDYPRPGSSYHVKVLPNAPYGISQGTLNASQSALAGLARVLLLKLGDTESEPVTEEPNNLDIAQEQDQPTTIPNEQQYFVAECQPPLVFSYHLDYDCKTFVTWRLQSIPLGTRILYEEIFCDDNVVSPNFTTVVNRVVKEWLTNIKRYNELRGARGRLLVKWFLDRFYLQLRPDQRRVVLMMLVMQAIGLATFTIAALGWGVTRLFT